MLLWSRSCWSIASLIQSWTPRSLAWLENCKFTCVIRQSSSHSRPHRAFRKYTSAEDTAIVQGRGDGQTWDTIASQLDRTIFGVRHRFYSHLLGSNPQYRLLERKEFTFAEDRSIMRLRNEEGRSFREIAETLGRSPASIDSRYRRYLGHHLITGDPKGRSFRRVYTPAEIREVVRLREQQCLSFSDIAVRLGRRLASIQRAYYLHKTSPGRETKWYSKAEDERLLELRNMHGPRWKTIAQHMSPRTDWSVKKRFSVLEDRAKRLG